jgi:hypothetical protein
VRNKGNEPNQLPNTIAHRSCLWWSSRLLGSLLLVLLLISCISGSYLVAIAGYRIHINCASTGPGAADVSSTTNKWTLDWPWLRYLCPSKYLSATLPRPGTKINAVLVFPIYILTN